MGLTKSDNYTEFQNSTASYFKVLGHPARIAILQHILKQNACVCGDIVDELGLAQATVSQHLKELKSLGIIKGNIEGTSVCYCIDESNWEVIKEQLGSFLDQLDTNKSCC